MALSDDPALARLHDVITRINAGGDVDAVLQAIADGVVAVSGFETATINVLRAGEREFELVAVGGDDPLLRERLHFRYPVEVVLPRLELGEQWGAFRFVSHELDLALPEGYIVLDQQASGEPDAWHPLDELAATLLSADGDLIGVLYVDCPGDGRRPGPEVLALMDIFAVAAGVALDQAQRHAAEHEAVWLAGLGGAVLDAVAGPSALPERLDRTAALLRSELGAEAVWLDVFPPAVADGVGPQPDDGIYAVAAALDSYGDELARHTVDTGEALVVRRDTLAADHPWLTDQQRSWLGRALDHDNVVSLALAPLDNDLGLAGQLVLARRTDRPWSAQVGRTLREIGREIGWALGRQQSRDIARAAEEEIERAARERRQMLEALVRAVGPQFASLDAHAETLPADDPVRRAIDVCWTVYDRVSALASFENPAREPEPAALDLTRVLEAQLVDLVDVGRARGVRVQALETSGERVVWADPAEVEWVVQVVLEDAVERAAPGSSVRFVLVTMNQRVLLSCLISGSEAEGDAAGTAAPADPSWWEPSAHRLLARTDGRLSARDGPGGRRVVSLSLPVPDIAG